MPFRKESFNEQNMKTTYEISSQQTVLVQSAIVNPVRQTHHDRCFALRFAT